MAAAAVTAAAEAGLEYTSIDDIPRIVNHLRAAFLTGKTRSIEYRKNQLKQLAYMFKDHQDDFVQSLQKDLGRSRFESIFAELMGTTNEIVEAVNKLDKWAKPQKPWAGAAWAMHGASIRSEPKGTVLVLGAWNYPITVQVGPVIGAIAAGNTVILKPSEVAGHTAKLLAELWNKYLDPECYRIVNGGIPETTAILDQRFEHIFYTGNGTVGRIIAEKAAKWLCPTTLELGGKSPVYVDKSADLAIAAHRILWGKAFNCGQTCIAPDYVLIPHELQDKFVAELQKAYARFYPEMHGGVNNSDSYARIINTGHWKRLTAMLSGTKGKVVIGGEGDETSKFLPPTVISDVKVDDPVMAGEIFGPLLPIVPTTDVKSAVDFINSRDQPLALYLFAGDNKVKDFFFDNTRSGACVQGDTLLHFAVDALPFGGTGPSGYGNYHGKASFDQFSHQRASLDAPSTGILGKIIELVMSSRYPPYTEANLKKMRALAGYSVSFKRPSNPHKSVTNSSVSNLAAS
ncbi:related to aldehyde dehydrogenase [NAD(P)] [Melanopsichium pennsylvanicum]|uniref:Aldehyde dehydrogenase n=2 Tax=Melanopsichium pennsylvanicum TaxID=63383 RepID=A0AAJ4XTQ7_9BASI|nr:related to aldehyde dehydrogenase [NAD(P)] [Melanopsichium pennsylvanicum 4]SNX88106.1 related to aldehyde dehydrogenase [NAD(P)] [Melanopsichium pennsylvanicum]